MAEAETRAQLARQRTRTRGRYADYPSCEGCGKRISPVGYCSWAYTNEEGLGLMLCDSCSVRINAMPRDEAKAYLLARQNA
jgi:hypothetical protein